MNLSKIISGNLIARGKLVTITFLPKGDSLSAVSLSGLQLNNKAVEIAQYINKKTNYTVDPERHVLLAMASGLTFVATFLAALYAGVTIAPVPVSNNKLQQKRFNTILANCNANEILCDEGSYEILKATLPAKGYRLHCIPNVTTFDQDLWSIPEELEELLGFNKHAQDPAYVQYTSGSIHNPKGILISQANALHNIALNKHEWMMDAHTKVGSWLPHYHDMGLGAILTSLIIGAEFVFMSPLSFVQKPLRWLQMISHFSITVSGGPSFAYQRCIQTISQENQKMLALSSWKTAFVGAEIVHKKVVDEFNSMFHSAGLPSDALFACYGMAETNLFITGRHLSNAEAHSIKKADSIIQPCLISKRTKSSIAIVDFKTNQVIKHGAYGEIWIQSESLTQGYIELNKTSDVHLNQDPFNARAPGLIGNWFPTGDIGSIKDNFLYVLGRKKDFLKINGMNVATADIIWVACQVHSNLNPLAAVSFRLDSDYHDQSALLIETYSNEPIDVLHIEKSIRAKLRTNFGLAVNDILILKRGSLERTSSGKIRHQIIAQYYTKEAYLPKMLVSMSQM